MKYQMNFTTSLDDVTRFTSAEDLRRFYKEHGCDGLEVMPLAYSTKKHRMFIRRPVCVH